MPYTGFQLWHADIWVLMDNALKSARQQLAGLLEATQRLLDIASPTLEPLLFDDEAVVESLTALARRGARTRIRLLIASDQPSAFENHRLVGLAQRLTTAVSLRVLEHHPEWQQQTMIISDRNYGILLTPKEKRLRTLDNPLVASRWADTFERLWQASAESLELRQFY